MYMYDYIDDRVLVSMLFFHNVSNLPPFSFLSSLACWIIIGIIRNALTIFIVHVYMY